jgi:hypothetical protein
MSSGDFTSFTCGEIGDKPKKMNRCAYMLSVRTMDCMRQNQYTRESPSEYIEYLESVDAITSNEDRGEVSE